MAKKIMIDAGHYSNYNRSNVFKSYYEGNMTWKWQQYIVQELKEYGFVVGVTRTNRDKDVSVYNRGYMAKGYDMFLSGHTNWCEIESVDRVVIIKGYDQPDTLPKKFGSELTKLMGVNQNYQIMTRKTNSGGEYYGVLRGAKAAGVANRFIIEHSFHSNLKATKWLSVDDNIKSIAVLEAKIIADHYGYKKKLSTSIVPTKSDSTEWKNGDYNCKVKATANLNARKGRGTNNPKIYTIPKGTEFTVGYVYNNWASTWDFKGQVLYICCDYIEKV